MILALDTNILVEILRQRRLDYENHLDRVRSSGGAVVMSSICLHELMFGALVSQRPERQLEIVDNLVCDIRVDPWTAEDALVAAHIRADLDKTGQRMGVFDLLIAAHAIRCGATLVTNDMKDFIRVGMELSLMDWRVSDQPLDQAAILAEWRRRLEK